MLGRLSTRNVAVGEHRLEETQCPIEPAAERSTPDRWVSQVIVYHPAEVEVEVDDGEEAAEDAHRAPA